MNVFTYCGGIGRLSLFACLPAEVMEAYAQVSADTEGRERWSKIAVKDLEQHSQNQAGAVPIAADVIAAVAALKP